MADVYKMDILRTDVCLWQNQQRVVDCAQVATRGAAIRSDWIEVLASKMEMRPTNARWNDGAW